MKQQPKRNEIDFFDPLGYFAMFVLMAAILFVLFVAVQLLQTNEKSRSLTIGNSILLGEVPDNGKTQD